MKKSTKPKLNKCVFEDFHMKSRGRCKTHGFAYDPLLWHGGKKFCPFSCNCFSCKVLQELLNKIHSKDGRTANSMILQNVNKIFESWGRVV